MNTNTLEFWLVLLAVGYAGGLATALAISAASGAARSTRPAPRRRYVVDDGYGYGYDRVENTGGGCSTVLVLVMVFGALLFAAKYCSG